MLLTIDVGNTNIALGLMDGNNIIGRYRLTTKNPYTSDEYGVFISSFMMQAGITKKEIDAVLISSVVPKLMYSLNSAIIKFIGLTPVVVNSGIKTNIKLMMENPSSVGADRIVNTTWAWNQYHRSCIVVDFGTATTFDYVNKDGEFKYVIITPGLGISAGALTSQTAKLPDIEIRKPASILGRTTIEGMQAGVVFGYIGQVEYIIRQMKKELNDPDCYVVATGGLGRVIACETDEIDEYDPDIAYKGMYLLYEMNKESIHE